MDSSSRYCPPYYDKMLDFADSTFMGHPFLDSMFAYLGSDTSALDKKWMTASRDLIDLAIEDKDLDNYILNQTDQKDEILQHYLGCIDAVYDSSSAYADDNLLIHATVVADFCGAVLGGLKVAMDQYEAGDWGDGLSWQEAYDMAWEALWAAAFMSVGVSFGVAIIAG